MNEVRASKEMLIDDLTKNPSVENIAKALCYLLRTSVTEEEAKALHHRECEHCPALQKHKAAAAQGQHKDNDLVSRIFSPMFLLFIITIFSLFTAMYCVMGSEGFSTVTRGAKTTLQPLYNAAPAK